MNEILTSLEGIVWTPIIGEDWKKDYTQLTRTKEQEDSFREYLIELFKNKKIVKEVAKYPNLIKNKKMRTKLADEFLLTHWPKTIYE